MTIFYCFKIEGSLQDVLWEKIVISEVGALSFKKASYILVPQARNVETNFICTEQK